MKAFTTLTAAAPQRPPSLRSGAVVTCANHSPKHTMTRPITYLSLKLASARKAGQRSTDDITYRILTDAQRQDLFITIVGNKSSGCYSREIVPLAAVELCLSSVPKEKPFPGKIFRGAFFGKSVNNAGFMLALLKNLDLVKPAAEIAHQYQVTGDWAQWKASMLACEGEVYVPVTKEVQPVPAEAEIIPAASEPEPEPAQSQPRRKGRKAMAEEAISHGESDDDRAA